MPEFSWIMFGLIFVLVLAVALTVMWGVPKNKKLRTVTSIMTGLAVAMTLSISPTVATADTRNAETHSTESISDDDLLRGLIYGQGPIADKLGLQVTLPPDLSKAEYTKAVEYSIQELKAKYPDKLQKALAMLRDDDPVVVEKGLDGLSSILLEYEKDKLHGQTPDAEPSACGVAVVCVAYAAAAVHNTVAVTGLAVLVMGAAVAAGQWLWVGKSNSSPSTVREELVADLIAVT